MHLKSCLVLLPIFMLPSAAALAQSAALADEMTSCSQIADNQARLACYDQGVAALGARQARIAEARAQQQEAEKRQRAAAAQKAKEEAKRRAAAEAKANFGSEALPPDQKLAGTPEKLDQVRVKITEMGRYPYGDFYVVTEDGQVWRQNGGRPLSIHDKFSEAVIKRGALGSFILSFPESGRSYKVKRVR